MTTFASMFSCAGQADLAAQSLGLELVGAVEVLGNGFPPPFAAAVFAAGLRAIGQPMEVAA